MYIRVILPTTSITFAVLIYQFNFENHYKSYTFHIENHFVLGYHCGNAYRVQEI
jgi:hypothetical protein